MGSGTRTQRSSRSARSGAAAVTALLLFSCVLHSWAADEEIYEERVMGINYGRIADNIMPIPESVAMIKQMKFGKVRIYDADPAVLSALANTGLSVTMSVTTDLISGIATDSGVADQWIASNVVAYPNTKIRYIIVGNELFTYPNLNTTWYQILPAMNHLHNSLVSRGLSDTVKVTTCLAMDILAASYPPSTGAFRSDIATPLMQPILQFIYNTKSTFFVNVYPYFAWAANAGVVSVNYALFETGSLQVTVMDGQTKYTSLLDAQVDAIISAMAAVGYGNTNLAVGETGWPTGGDAGQAGTNVPYAAKYNRRLVRRTMSNPPVGTPKRPGQFFPTFIFALYNEDLKPGAGTERHWGLLYPNGSAIYPIDLTGQTSESNYPSLGEPAHAPTSSSPGSGSAGAPAQSAPYVSSGTWCVANKGASVNDTQTAMDWACGVGGADCAPIQTGGSCFQPDTLYDHAGYAFNSYFQQFKKKGGSCDFDGAAQITTNNPSPANNTGCVFPYTP